MSVIFIALPVALLIATAAVIAFTVSALRGQFDDLKTPAYRILLDDAKRIDPAVCEPIHVASTVDAVATMATDSPIVGQ